MRRRKEKHYIVALALSLTVVLAGAGITFYSKNKMSNEQTESNYVDLEETVEDVAEILNETQVETESMTEEESNTEESQVILEGEYSSEEVNAAASDNVVADTLYFGEDSTLTWPVKGEVLLDYSMDSTIYFPTLDQYKCNEAMVIQSDINTEVLSSAKGIVSGIYNDEETGNTVTVSLGNNYEVVYGQLKEVEVAEGDVVEAGAVIGYVNEPTKYYSVEGYNLYFEVIKDGVPVDPMNYLK